MHTFNLARFVTYFCSESASAAVNYLCVASVKPKVICEGERGIACSPQKLWLVSEDLAVLLKTLDQGSAMPQYWMELSPEGVFSRLPSGCV